MAECPGNRSNRWTRSQFRIRTPNFLSGLQPVHLGDIMGDNNKQPLSPSGFLSTSDIGASERTRTRTVREYEETINELKKENFELKLKVYFFEESFRKHYQKDKGPDSEDNAKNVEICVQLNVEIESLRNELKQKEILLQEAINEAEKYQRGYKELEEKVIELEEQLSLLSELPSKEEIEGLIVEREDLIKENESLRKDISEQNEEISLLNERMEIMCKEVNTLQEKLKSKGLAIQSLVYKTYKEKELLPDNLRNIAIAAAQAAKDKNEEDLVNAVKNFSSALYQMIGSSCSKSLLEKLNGKKIIDQSKIKFSQCLSEETFTSPKNITPSLSESSSELNYIQNLKDVLPERDVPIAKSLTDLTSIVEHPTARGKLCDSPSSIDVKEITDFRRISISSNNDERTNFISFSNTSSNICSPSENNVINIETVDLEQEIAQKHKPTSASYDQISQELQRVLKENEELKSCIKEKLSIIQELKSTCEEFEQKFHYLNKESETCSTVHTQTEIAGCKLLQFQEMSRLEKDAKLSDNIDELREDVLLLMLTIEGKNKELSEVKESLSAVQKDLKNAIRDKKIPEGDEDFENERRELHERLALSYSINIELMKHLKNLETFMENLLQQNLDSSTENISERSDFFSSISKCLNESLKLSNALSDHLSVCEASKLFEEYESFLNKNATLSDDRSAYQMETSDLADHSVMSAQGNLGQEGFFSYMNKNGRWGNPVLSFGDQVCSQYWRQMDSISKHNISHSTLNYNAPSKTVVCLSSDSDIWSEPDRDVSMQRIGINLNSPLTSKSPRRYRSKDRKTSSKFSSEWNGSSTDKQNALKQKRNGSSSRRLFDRESTRIDDFPFQQFYNSLSGKFSVLTMLLNQLETIKDESVNEELWNKLAEIVAFVRNTAQKLQLAKEHATCFTSPVECERCTILSLLINISKPSNQIIFGRPYILNDNEKEGVQKFKAVINLIKLECEEVLSFSGSVEKLTKSIQCQLLKSIDHSEKLEKEKEIDAEKISKSTQSQFSVESDQSKTDASSEKINDKSSLVVDQNSLIDLIKMENTELSNQIKSLKDDILLLEEKEKKLILKNYELHKQLSATNQMNEDLKNQLLSVHKKEKEYEEKLSSLESNEKELDSKNLELVKKYSDVNQINADLKNQLSLLEQKEEELLEENTKLEEKCSNLNKINSDLQEQLSLFEQKNNLDSQEKINEECLKMNQININLKEQLISLQQKEKELLEKNAKLDENCTNLSKINSDLNKQVSLLEQKNVDLKEKLSLVENNEPKEEYTKVNQINEQKEKELLQTNSDLDAQFLKANKNVADLTEKLNKLQIKYSDLYEINADLKNKLSLLEEKEKELLEKNTELDEKCSNLNKVNSDLKKQLSSFELKSSDLEKEHLPVEKDLLQKNNELNEECLKMNQINLDLKEQLFSLKQKQKELMETNSELNEKFLETDKDNKNLTEKVSSLQKNEAELLLKNNELLEKYSDLNQINVELKEKLLSFEQKEKDLLQKNNELNKIYSDLSKINSNLKEHISLLEQNEKNLLQRINELDKKCSKFDQINIDLEQELLLLKQKEKELMQKNSELDEKFLKTNEDNTDLIGKLSSFERNEKELSLKNNELLKKYSDVNQINCDLRNQLLLHEQKEKELLQEIDELNEKCSNLNKINSDLKNQFSLFEQKSDADLKERSSMFEQTEKELLQKNNELNKECLKVNQINANLKEQLLSLEKNEKELIEENMKLDEKCSKINEINSDLKKQLSLLEQKENELLQINRELNEKCAKIDQINADLEKELLSFNEKEKELMMKNSELEEKCSNMIKECANLQEELLLLKQKEKELTLQNNELNKKCSDTNKDNAELKRILKNMEEKSNMAFNQLSEELQRTKLDLTTLNTKCLNYENELESQVKLKNNFAEQIKELQASSSFEKENCFNKIKNLDLEKDKYIEMLKNSEQKISSLQNENITLCNNLEISRKEYCLLQELVEKLENQNENWNTTCRNLQLELNAAKTQLNELREKCMFYENEALVKSKSGEDLYKELKQKEVQFVLEKQKLLDEISQLTFERDNILEEVKTEKENNNRLLKERAEVDQKLDECHKMISSLKHANEEMAAAQLQLSPENDITLHTSLKLPTSNAKCDALINDLVLMQEKLRNLELKCSKYEKELTTRNDMKDIIIQYLINVNNEFVSNKHKLDELVKLYGHDSCELGKKLDITMVKKFSIKDLCDSIIWQTKKMLEIVHVLMNALKEFHKQSKEVTYPEEKSRHENELSQSQNGYFTKTIDELQEVIAQKENSNQINAHEIQVLKDKLCNVQNELEQKKSELKIKDDEITHLQEKLFNLQVYVNNVVAENSKLHGKITSSETMRAGNSDSSIQCADGNYHTRSLNSSFDSAVSAASDISKNSCCKKYWKKYCALKTKLILCDRRVEMLEKEKNDLREDFMSHLQNKQGDTNEKEELKLKVLNLESQLKQKKTFIQELKNQLLNQFNSMIEKDEEIDNLKEKISELEKKSRVVDSDFPEFLSTVEPETGNVKSMKKYKLELIQNIFNIQKKFYEKRGIHLNYCKKFKLHLDDLLLASQKHQISKSESLPLVWCQQKRDSHIDKDKKLEDLSSLELDIEFLGNLKIFLNRYFTSEHTTIEEKKPSGDSEFIKGAKIVSEGAENETVETLTSFKSSNLVESSFVNILPSPTKDIADKTYSFEKHAVNVSRCIDYIEHFLKSALKLNKLESQNIKLKKMEFPSEEYILKSKAKSLLDKIFKEMKMLYGEANKLFIINASLKKLGLQEMLIPTSPNKPDASDLESIMSEETITISRSITPVSIDEVFPLNLSFPEASKLESSIARPAVQKTVLNDSQNGKLVIASSYDSMCQRSQYSSPDLGIESDPNHDSSAPEQKDDGFNKYQKIVQESKVTSRLQPKTAFTTTDSSSRYKGIKISKGSIYSIGELKHYELLKKEIQESLVGIKSVLSRTGEGLTCIVKYSPRKDLESKTLKAIKDTCINIEVCLKEAYKLVEKFHPATLPTEQEWYNLIKENEDLNEQLYKLKNIISTQESKLKKAMEHIEKADLFKTNLDKKVAKKLIKTKNVYRNVEEKLREGFQNAALLPKYVPSTQPSSSLHKS